MDRWLEEEGVPTAVVLEAEALKSGRPRLLSGLWLLLKMVILSTLCALFPQR